jgi:outer membrane murein-binding lipoprotein Lpp
MMLFAAEDASTVFTYSGLVLAGGGLIAWILKSALPSLLNNFRDMLEKSQAAHSQELSAARSDFMRELSSTRAEFRAELALNRADNRAMNDKLSTAIDGLAGKIEALEEHHIGRRNV